MGGILKDDCVREEGDRRRNDLQSAQTSPKPQQKKKCQIKKKNFTEHGNRKRIIRPKKRWASKEKART